MTDRSGGRAAGPARSRNGAWRLLVVAASLLTACGYYHYAGPLCAVDPAAPDTEATGPAEVRWTRGGFVVQVRALSPEELNHQFASRSAAGRYSTNPYTYGATPFWDGRPERERFVVFRLSVTNGGYAKVKVDPARMLVRTADGQELWPMGLQQLQAYYRAYVTGYEGNAYGRYQERLDILRRTMFSNEEIFLGQQKEGHVVFPVLPAHVRQVSVVLEDVVLRFDARGEPVETVEITFPFRRDTGRLYGDGRLVLDSPEP